MPRIQLFTHSIACLRNGSFEADAVSSVVEPQWFRSRSAVPAGLANLPAGAEVWSGGALSLTESHFPKKPCSRWARGRSYMLRKKHSRTFPRNFNFFIRSNGPDHTHGGTSASGVSAGIFPYPMTCGETC